MAILTGTEWDLMKSAGDQCARQGKAYVTTAAKVVGLSSDYARIVFNDLGRKDLVDTYQSGKIEMTRKGWSAIRQKGWEPPEGAGHAPGQDPATPLSPMDNLRRLYDQQEITGQEYMARRLTLRRQTQGWAGLQPEPQKPVSEVAKKAEPEPWSRKAGRFRYRREELVKKAGEQG